ncbi:MAG: hypothetical protein JNK58_05390 [Phycisphaerae bacterium]|nr:hypothetical protein [Phycisphaerae bacterium]
MKKMSLLSVAGLLFCAGIVAVAVSSTTVNAAGIRLCGPRNCLDVWNPVTCSNGVTYSNACYAARACATGCSPSGGI